MLLGPDMLVRKRHLAEQMRRVRIAHGKRAVTCVHLMFDAHQIIFAESFYPGPMSLRMIEVAQRRDLMDRFPRLATAPSCRAETERSYGATARAVAGKGELSNLLSARNHDLSQTRTFT